MQQSGHWPVSLRLIAEFAAGEVTPNEASRVIAYR
jgi:hypothetical protein